VGQREGGAGAVISTVGSASVSTPIWSDKGRHRAMKVLRMKDRDKSKGQPISELTDLRQRVAELEAAEADRKRTEELLQEEREASFSILQKAPYGVLLIDQEERCLYANPEFTRITGRILDEIPTVGDWFQRAFPDPAYRAEVTERWKSDTVQRISRVFSVVCGDGEVKEVEFRPTLLDSGRAILVLSDVTKRKRAEEALQESEEKFRNLAEQSPNMIFINKKGRVVYANKRCEEATGYTRDELCSADFSFLTLIAPEHRESVEARFRKHMQGEELEPYDLALVAKGGTRAEVMAITKLIDYAGERAILGTVIDITERKGMEQALRASEERYRVVSELISDFAYAARVDLDGTIASEWTTGAFTRITGFTLDEFNVRGGWERFVHPDDVPRVAEFLQLLLSGEPATGEFRLITKSGEARWIRDYGRPVSSESGDGVVRVVGAVQDITERKQAEEALRESEERFRQMAENSRDVFWMRDLKTLDLIYITPAYERLWGQSIEDAHERPTSWLTNVHPEDRERLAAAFEKQVQGEPTENEYRIVWPDGSVHWIRDRVFPVRDEAGEAYRTFGVVEDVTGRKWAEAERERLLVQIQEQVQHVQQIVDTVPEGVLLLDAKGQTVMANPLGERDLATLARAKVGDTLTHLGDRPLDELLTSPPRGLWHELTADGRSFQVLARPIETGSAPGRWLLVIRDVTQQREVEQRIQQQERLAAVGQLAAGIAHDFNNVMATIVLYAQMTAWMEGLPDTARERMQTIDQQAKQASTLIQQILDFSRRAVLERRPLDLASLLKEHVKLLERTLLESIEIRLDYEPDEHATSFIVDADPARMQQMVTNLALNARDAMPEGGILCLGLERIEIRPGESPLLPEMEPGEWVRLTVSDTGTGIPPDVLPHMFEPFFTTKGPGLGTGLGLAQVHGIVAQHEGRIDVHTELGRGTTFTIYLPARLPEPPTAIPLRELPATTMGQGETVLVVEDDASVRKALVESLELLNYRVLEAMNGREALAKVEELGNEIELVLSDVVMPGMGGIALLHALRERGLGVPVVMLTGHPLEKEMEDLRAQGLLEWLPKPPRLEELAEVMASALKEGSD
jgi:two-component system cell cycle sensor histidine kinase/response regulator CckA